MLVGMKFNSAGKDTSILRLDPGDDIVASIQRFCRDQAIVNAEVSGIGSVQDPLLAHYRIDQHKYREQQLKGIFEIASLLGSVAPFDGVQLAHLHVVVSDEQMRAFGGHLVKGAASATAELVVRRLSSSYKKHLNSEVGLRIWDLN
jgi:uncharacterized protein